MKIKILNFIAVVSSLLFLFSCSNSGIVQSGSYKYLYDYDSKGLHPEYLVYHFSDDSSRVFFRIQSEELLYARTSVQTPFLTKLNIKCKLSNQDITDTCSIQITDATKAKDAWLLGSFDIKIPTGDWNMSIDFTDLNRNITQTHYLSIDKSSNYSAQNILIRNAETDEPVFGNYIRENTEISIESARNTNGKAPNVVALSNDQKLPPPPFSSNYPTAPAIGSDFLKLAPADSLGRFYLKAENKDYFFSYDNTLDKGLMLRTASTDFPEIKLAKSLEWPLRYITTKAEFEQITKSTYPKKLIDNFWIECAGNKTKARELIRIYYSRVEAANYYFSSYTEGWRTDRGMIHIVFGSPTKITKYTDREIWQYGEDNTPNQLTFIFQKESNPLSDNIYVLNRDPAFKPYWERMVTIWRSGRIYNF